MNKNHTKAEQLKRNDALRQGREKLESLSEALCEAYRGFNSSTDPVVMDACIFEINALRARRNLVLRELREIEQAGVPSASGKENLWKRSQAYLSSRR